MRIAIGSDHRGYSIRPKIVTFLKNIGHEVIDLGTFSQSPVDYPDIAEAVAKKVASGEADRGILFCGTGLGMCIAANKIPGVRAAPCHDDLTAELSRRHNDANVLCLSADLLGERLITRIVEVWLNTPFEGGRHARRVEKIAEIEKELLQDCCSKVNQAESNPFQQQQEDQTLQT
ncbi:MAG: ribose 5-phosphate isomerase B [Thermogutta sp.]|uniref:ribose 5-phosphate isomerase B n=1 Tax=Thermogutta sp. TaxID=1962930 RepID=UPI001994052F|nr:ribose 5-phosphate isomerase B [Thermogutta sp.]MBC7353180.1 ribose 5-phosphate isomerase B [Thermogutta sp.]